MEFPRVNAANLDLDQDPRAKGGGCFSDIFNPECSGPDTNVQLRVPYSSVIRHISPISAYPLLGGGFCS